jgi:hypothetical protein
VNRWLLYALILAQLTLIVRLLHTATWRTIPTFTAYLCAAIVLSLLPLHPDSAAWWAWWTYPQTAILILLAVAVAESLFRLICRIPDRVYIAAEGALVGAGCAWVAWGLHRIYGPPFPFIAWRTRVFIFLAATLLTVRLYVWHRPSPIPLYARRHATLLVCLLANHAAVAVFSATLGKGQEGAWYVAQAVYVGVAAVVYVAWTLAVPRKGEA